MQGRIPEAVRTRPRGGLLNSFYLYGFNQRIEWIRRRLSTGEVDWPRFAERGKIKDMLEVGTTRESDIMLIMQCVYYEMWLDRYFR